MSTSKHTLIISAIALLAALSGCIKNDIPFPRIQANIADIEVEQQLQAASIDSIARTVTVFLDESADIQNVRATRFALTPAGAYWPDSVSFAAGVDLSNPVKTTVSLYQDYEWTISAVQNIERYFTVEGQIGASTIDPIGQRVVLYVPEHVNLGSILVTSIKLAGPNATYSPMITDTRVDFTRPFEIEVTEHGRTSTWTIYIQVTDSNVTLERVDAWTNVAWVYVAAQEGSENGIQYRAIDDLTWTELPADDIEVQGGALKGCIKHLQPESTYLARAYTGEEFSNEVEFTTGATYSIPNGSMDDWWLDGKVWCPWAEGAESYWDTGNKGATTLGTSNTYPSDDTSSGNGQAACLETRFVGIGSIGKLAAGNLFAGRYVRTDGTNGILDFGRPFTLHPTKLRGYLKYKSTPISHSSAGYENLKGQPDTCVVWCALIDANEPFQIRTNPANRNLFNPDAPDVVAYGIIQYGYSIDNYVPFEVNLEYKDTQRSPRYMLLVASASKYGDYFTGGNGSILMIDNLTLGFDY